MSSKKLKIKSAIFLQVRLTSDRLPQKAFFKLEKKSMLQHIIERFINIKNKIDYIVVLCPEKDKLQIQQHLSKYPNIIIFGGDETNVLKRFYDANKLIEANIIIRTTGDNPLVDTTHLIKALNFHLKVNNDYTIFKNLPLGTGVEILSEYALNEAFFNAKKEYQKEHVTPYIREAKERFKITFLEPEEFYNHPEFRLTVDETPDYELMKTIYKNLYKNKPIPMKDVITFLNKNKFLLDINSKVIQIKIP